MFVILGRARSFEHLTISSGTIVVTVGSIIYIKCL